MNAQRKAPALQLKVTDPVTRLVLVTALREYSSAQYVEASALREGRNTRDRPDAKSWDKQTREMAAAGCTARMNHANALANKLEGV